MPVEMVDSDRNSDCSNGLHIARRDYLGSLNGDVMVLVKVAPEDVVSVPKYDASKMRVAGYHILARLNNTAFNLLSQNRPMTSDDESSKILANALKGIHIDVLETVFIGGQHGSDIKIKKIEVDKDKKLNLEDIKAYAIEMNKEGQLSKPIDVKSIQNTIKQTVDGQSIPKEQLASLKPKVKIKADLSDALTKMAEKETKKPAVKEESSSKKDRSELPSERQKALEMIDKGCSKAEAERKTGVSTRTIGRLIEAGY
jgi:hypothetical protein